MRVRSLASKKTMSRSVKDGTKSMALKASRRQRWIFASCRCIANTAIMRHANRSAIVWAIMQFSNDRMALSTLILQNVWAASSVFRRVNLRRYTSTRRPVKWKSHLCMHRIDQGLAPACVITCLAITREFGEFTDLQALHPDAKRMGDRGRMLYGHLGEDPRTTTDRPTSSYPNPIPCHD